MSMATLGSQIESEKTQERERETRVLPCARSPSARMTGLEHVLIGARTMAQSGGRRNRTAAKVPEGRCRHGGGEVLCTERPSPRCGRQEAWDFSPEETGLVPLAFLKWFPEFYVLEINSAVNTFQSPSWIQGDRMYFPGQLTQRAHMGDKEGVCKWE